MRRALFLIPLAVSTLACSDAAEVAERTGVQPTASATDAAATAAAPAAKAFAFTENAKEPGGGTFEITYKWPAAVSAEAPLAAQLEKHRAERLAEGKKDWESAAEACPPDSVSCRSYAYSNEYQVVANLPRYLSLTNKFYTYTGGAHGIYGKDSAIWDREAGALLDPKALFATPAALQRAIGGKACAALDTERQERRGEAAGGPDGGSPGEWPNNCPGIDEAALFVGSSNGRAFDRLGVYYGPYVAGAYAEGEYEIDLPVDAAVMAALKPEYRGAFAIGR